MFFRSYVCFVRLKISLQADEIVPTSFVRKNLYVFNNKFFSITTICFVSFLYSVFNEHGLYPLGEITTILQARLPLIEPPTKRGLALASYFWSDAFCTQASFALLPYEPSLAESTLLKPLCLVGPSGLEPPTSCLSGTRSNLLSYEPMWLVSKWSSSLGFFTSLFSFLVNSEEWKVKRWDPSDLWWRWRDSNPWPPACRAGALPAELHPQKFTFGFGFRVNLHSFKVFRGGDCLPGVSIELSSRAVARKVFSPLQSLTSVFGMGTGGPSAFITLTFSLIQRTISLFSENWTTNSFFYLSRPSFTLQVVWPITLSPWPPPTITVRPPQPMTASTAPWTKPCPSIWLRSWIASVLCRVLPIPTMHFKSRVCCKTRNFFDRIRRV